MLSIQSPYSGEALVIDVPEPFIYNCRKDTNRNVSNIEIGIWLNSHGEVRKVIVNDFDELKSSLSLYYGCRKALQLALFSVDSDLDSALQQQSIALLEPFLENQAIFDWLQDLFCIQELPQPSIEILNQSLLYAKQNAFSNYILFYKPLFDKQAAIKLLANTWKQVEKSLMLGIHHQGLMDQTLGTGLFKSLIDKDALLEILELILLVLLKVRPNLESDFVLKVIHKSINFNFFSYLLGFEDTVFGIEALSLWPLIEKPSGLEIRKSESGVITPFECCGYNNADISVSSPSFPNITVSFALLPNLKTFLEGFIVAEAPSHQIKTSVSAEEKVKRWSNSLQKGACQYSSSTWPVRT